MWFPGRAGPDELLKSLGQTMAQVTQRIGRTDTAHLELHDDVVQRAQRRRRQRTVVTLTLVFLAMVVVSARPSTS